jgi:hypothetical protein
MTKRTFILVASFFIAAVTPLQSRAAAASASHAAMAAGGNAKHSKQKPKFVDLDALQKAAIVKINDDRTLSPAQRMYKLADINDDFTAARKAYKAEGAQAAL